MRAISRFVSFSRVVFSSAPVTDWKRRLNSSCLRSRNASSNWSSLMSLRSLAFKEIGLPFHDLRLHRQLVAREAKRLLRKRLRHAGELEHHAARLHDGDPRLGRALALAHARLGRLFRNRLVGEDVDPDLAAALDLARHRDTRGLDLAVRHPRDAGRLQAEVAELHGVLALRHTAPAAALLLAELRFLGEQHRLLRLSGRGLPAAARLLVLIGVARRRVLLRRRVGSLGDRCGHRLDLRLDRQLLAACGRRRGRVRARALDVVLSGRAVFRRGGTRTPAARSAGTRAGALAAAGTTRPAAPLDRPEAFAILAARPRRLARGAETFQRAAAATGVVLLAEARALACGGVALRHDLALVDPDLDADPAERRLRLDEAVVDVSADRVQRHAALGIGLRAAHLGAAEPATAGDLDPLRAGTDRGSERALHRAAERHAVLQLLGDRLRDELRVELGPLDLEDVDLDGLARELVQVAPQGVDLGSRLADHDARPRRVDVDLHLGGVLADRDVRQAGVRELVRDVVPDPDVLDQEVGEVLLGEPVRLPVVDVAHAHGLGMDLLTHVARDSFGVSVMVRCEVRLRMRVARPMARGRYRLSVGPSSAWTATMRRSSPTSSWLCSAFAIADSSSFSHGFAAARGVYARIARASTTSLPRM